MMKRSLLSPGKPKHYSTGRWLSFLLFRFFIIAITFLAIKTLGLLIVSNNKALSLRIEKHAGERLSYKYPIRFSSLASARQCWKDLSDALELSRPTITGFPSFEPMKAQNLEELNGEGVEFKNIIPYVFEDDLKDLKKSQDKFKSLIRKNGLNIPFSTGTSGIVIATDATRLPSVFLILKFLKLLESKLPVEVFLHTYSDYDEHLCKEVFPEYKATCRILQGHIESGPLPRMPNTNQRRRINRFEPLFKYLSVYFSSFQNVLFLDPNSLPVNRPDELFITEPFLSYGLLLWPDFWASSESPKVAEIQSRRPSSPFKPEDVRSIDLGQFVISKTIHKNTLLQAIYYATYGEGLYEPLFKQGEYGDRGADAIKFAAKLFQLPFYISERFVEAIGFPDISVKEETSTGEEVNPFRGIASLQSYPQDDYHKVNKWGQRPLFIHQDLHPSHLNPKSYVYAHNNEHHGMWEWFGAKDRIYDLKTDDPEKLVWHTLENIACQEKIHFRAWLPADKKKACAAILEHEQKMNYTRIIEAKG